MRKRIVASLLAAAMLVSVTGCANSGAAESTVVEKNPTVNTTEDVASAGEVASLEQLIADSLAPEVWVDHVEDDLMKFWSKPEAQDMSSGLFNTYLTNTGEKLSADSKEVQEALKDDVTKALIDIDNNYVRAHSRLTYAYGIAYHMTGKTEYFDMCRKGMLALKEALDEDCGMAVVKNKNTGAWDSDREARTSQDLAYGVTGLGMYYFLTHDKDVLDSIIKVKNYIFENYYDEDKGYITWYPKHVDDDQTQLVAQLDQLYAYMLMLTPSLPEPYQTEWKADMKMLADVMINRFYSEQHGLFWGVVNDKDVMVLGSDHTDFGHSVKTLWVIMKVGQVIGDPFYVEFAKPRIEAIIEDAYVKENGSWARKFNADGSLDARKEWWILAELDQAEEILSINDPTYYSYLNKTQRYWLDKMVDHENGEIHHMLEADGTIDPHYPKVHCWKTSLHSFEHALFGYMSAAQLTDSEFDLYYAFAEDEAITEDEVEVYMFSANGKELSKGDKIAGTEKQCVYKVKFNQLY